MSYRLTLFGSFAATVDGRPLPIRGEIPRAIVSRLAFRPGERVTPQELIDDVWREAPSGVVSSLRAHLSRLRAEGWSAVLSGGRNGYALEVDSADVDVARWRQLLETRGEGRIEGLIEAESLWRGQPFAGLDAPFAEASRPEFLRLRREAMLEIADARLETGENVDASLDLERLLRDLPGDSELTRRYAAALAGAGRAGDALDVIDAVMGDLGDHARGPLAELRRSIVRQDPVLLGRTDDRHATVERTGIPVPLTRFVGRAGELDQVATARAEARLVTLVGPAGVGKTRLAAEAARRAGADVDEQQWLVDLTVIVDPGHVLGVVADVVRAGSDTLDAVAARLTGRRTLLILDNAEHVLGAVASLASRLLGRCEGLAVMVTSREALRMPGERVVPVAPFVGDAAPDAVRLFLDRARDSSGLSQWDDHSMREISALCRDLDGLPLALELAAARLDVLSLAEVADSVQRGGTDAGRHGSLDSALGWSLDLLSPPEVDMLTQLARFAGSFGLDAVAGICVPAEGADARELAAALARKSLVTPLGTDTGARRFRLLDSVRRYVRQRDTRQDAHQWRDRHAAWFADWISGIEEQMRTAENARARTLLGAYRADLHAAVDHAVETGDRATAVRLLAVLAWYWFERGLRVDGLDTAERVLAMPGERDPAREARVLRACAYMAAVGADERQVARYMSRMRDAAAASDDAAERVLAATMSGYVAAVAGEADQADAYLTHATAEIAAAGDSLPIWARVDELMVRGDVLRALGRPSQALTSTSEAYRVSVEAGDAWGARSACYVTGKALVDVRRGKEAVGILRSGAIRSLEAEDASSALAAINVIAAACHVLGRDDDAVTIYSAIDVLGARHGYSALGSDPEHTERHRAAASAALDRDDLAAATQRGADLSLMELMRLVTTF
ncbi:BTAD domain-containing putative transcriptional regulator [Herbiconiux sp. L3-i23]|uniref:AfsR/SARP family transcriptional regulator n=1 Tax=Herbiconiux sp. L3-i23 TaxID=2905871 RepID=UPI00205EB376|nr:BTAD domain-containing putative transcriptional regulator [Herbiconiux sp. L3-i23]BDI22585.1 SARP family transcriptional regulator [Herbiconiux sp. L3-i23]